MHHYRSAYDTRRALLQHTTVHPSVDRLVRADAARRTPDLPSFVIHGAGPPGTSDPVWSPVRSTCRKRSARGRCGIDERLNVAPRHVSHVDVGNLDGCSGWLARSSWPRSCRSDSATVLTIHLCGL